ncbi:hypothetical protein GCM10009765_33490 [Fodinicola feengrottensis]|uniref:Polymerase nucleotidyl transferase domain-containing protein n=2 Tax=Fodinicola feengrottensis TaxID=435914 RepID=A0ABN2H3Z1_9ACTN
MVTESVVGYLEAVDALAPGLVEGFYLEGSAALGDFQPHSSDIDFVAVTADRPDTTALGTLAEVHAKLRNRRRPFLDGVYVTWEDLPRGGADDRRRPRSHGGRFTPDGSPPNPVTWHTLARYGVPLRGPQPADLEIWTDPELLTRWTTGNLDHYWRRRLDRSTRLASRAGVVSLSDFETSWTVPGVTRLHYTLATGNIASKQGACHYALGTFAARWHRIAKEALRLRTGAGGRSLYPTHLSRRRDVRDYAAMVIESAQALVNR